MDKGQETPVEYANIAIYSQLDSTLINGTISNENGVFMISKIPYGKYYLEANFIGYKKVIIPDIEISKDNKFVKLEKIEIEQAVEMLEGAEIIEEKSYIEYKIDKKIVNVSKHANAAGGTAADVLENVPSVNVDIEGNVTLRGSGSFTVLIDGKPSVMGANDILKQMPASAIENIEIITNPSAKYDPDGTSGIINLIMKKESKTGMNGMFSVSAGTSRELNFKRSTNFILNYRTSKVNYFLSANYNNEPSYQETDLFNKTYFDSLTQVATSTNYRNMGRGGWNVKGGADYYLDDKTTITLSSSVGEFLMDRNFSSTYHFYNEGMSNTDRYELANDEFNIDGLYYNLNLNLQKKFKKEGHEINFSAYYSNWDGLTTNDAERYTTLSSWNSAGLIPDRHQTQNINLNNDYRFKLDYTIPVGKAGKFETGGQLQFYNTDFDYSFENYDIDADSWTQDTVYSNKMEFFRDIYSGYATFSNQIFGFGYKMGLRTEYTFRELTQLTSNENYLFEKFQFFPSFSVSKELKKGHTLQMSYSRRINRPQPWFLNPFPDYTDNLIVSRGNPALEPEYIDSYEFNYFKRIKTSFISAGLYYRQNNNAMTQTITVVDTIMYIQQANLNQTKAGGLELAGNIQIKKWWSIYAGTNIFYYNVNGEISGSPIDTSAITYTINLSNTIKFGKSTRLQFNVYYNAPSIELQGQQKSFITGGLALRHDFMKRKATLTLNVRDPFNMFKYNLILDNPTFYTDFTMRNETPVVRLSLSYRINNYQRRQQEEEINIGGGGMF